MDAEDPSPVNPFHYWKERLRSDESEEEAGMGSQCSGISGGLASSPVKLRERGSTSSQSAEEDGSAFLVGSKRRPPPRPPTGPPSRPKVGPRRSPSPGDDGCKNPPGLQEKAGKVSCVQGRLERLAEPSIRGSGMQGTTGKYKASHSGSTKEWPHQQICGDTSNLSSKYAHQELGKPTSELRRGAGGAAGVREKIGRIEGISKLEAGSDADSYVPTFKKSPVKSPMHHPGHSPGHKPVRKSNSNPISEEGSSSKPVLQHNMSSGNLDCGNPPTTKFIPTIQTIRASTGDDLSVDLDLELYQPQKGRAWVSSHQSVKVLDVAKKIDSVLLGAQLPTHGGRGRWRRNSGGDLPSKGRRGSSGSDRDSFKTTASSPGVPRRHQSTSSSPGTPRHPSTSSETSTASTERLRSWRTQSASKRSSGKIKSSGFISYLDGPMESTSSPGETRPPSPPPPSPLHEMSDYLKSNNVPEGNHLRPSAGANLETREFWDMVQRLWSEHSPGNSISLASPVLSHQLQLPKSPQTLSRRRHDSVFISAGRTKEVVFVRVVSMEGSQGPVEFVSNVKSTVLSVLSRGLEQLERGGMAVRDPQELALKVCGKDEVLGSNRLLSDYHYIHQCRKFAVPVKLAIVDKKKPSPLRGRRSPLPDLSMPSALSGGLSKCVSLKEANSLLDSYHAKEEKFRSFLKSKDNPTYPFSMLTTMVQSVVSCVKLLCERLSFIEPPEITDAVFNLRRACKAASQPEFEASSLFSPDDTVSMSSSFSENWVAVPESEFQITEDNIEDIVCALDVLLAAVHRLMSLYCTSFLPGYQPEWDLGSRERLSIGSKPDHLLRVKVSTLHRPVEAELRKFDTLQMECCVYQGGKALSKRAYSPHAKLSRNFFKAVVWNKWMNMCVPLSSLPPESRVLFTLHGLEFPGSGSKWSRTPIAWAILRLFDCEGCLLRGSHLLGMWLGEDADPLDSPYCNMHNRKSMLLQVELEDHNHDLFFRTPIMDKSKSNLPGPPPNVSKMLTAITQKDRFYALTTSDQKILWANRLACVSLLGGFPRGLPMVLLASQTSEGNLAETWQILDMWKLSDPIFGLELLDPQFADMKVRKKAVEWLSNLSNDDLFDFLPQLVQSLRYDSYLSSPMSEFLLKRSTQSHRVAHDLFWHLRLVTVTDVRFRYRYLPILEALEKLCGEQMHHEFVNQVELVEQLCVVATAVKSSRDAHRQTTLIQELKKVTDKFIGQFRLPLNPSLLVKGIDIEACSFFNSNTVPLKLSFINADPFGENISIIFKVGDDLRQDIAILQMIRLMEKIWLRAGLDLKMVTYECVATGAEEGMLEMVTESATLRAIQTQHGLTGSFKDKPLSDWLQKHNTSESAYKQAVENFTLSCAGYCVATYVLGICDRHNDNVMVKKSGHMFHIDFGKILGNAQMFGNIKRDRAPFVLTRDMAYVINDGDKPTVQFQKFCDLCCTAYNELRKHTTLFVSLLSLILSSGLPEITSLEDVQYVRDALLPGKSEAEATYAFTKYIEESLGSLATTLNFFIHNLAQFKFASSSNTPSLLSFSPQAYSIATDGKIESAIITTYHKWFYPETYYVYQVEVQRGGPEKEKVFRRYREFDELQNKLEQCFPDADLPQLPGKIFIPGKSHTKQTTERRMIELNMYMAAILSMPTSISESDIIYTFFHCLIRDEQDLAKLSEDEVKSSDYSAGKVKLEMHYLKKQEKLSVMVRHVKDLIPREGSDTADPYVKLYLLPDQNKSTKKKTKISKKTLNPTYNETFSYSVTPSVLGNRALQLSIWDASNMISNHCICMTTIELSKLLTQLNSGANFVEWFELFSLPDL